MKRLFTALLCLCLLVGLFSMTASAADRHRIYYDYETLPLSKLSFTVGDTVTLPFKLYRGSQASSYERYYIFIYNPNGEVEFQCVEDFSFGSSSIIKLSLDWTVNCEPGTYYLEYYDSATYSTGHSKIPMQVKAREGEHFALSINKTQPAVVGNPNQATSAWINTTAVYQEYSIYTALPFEIQLKEMYIGATANGIAYSESSSNDDPANGQQWIFMKFFVKNLGTEALQATDIIYEDLFYTKQGAKFKVFQSAYLSGSRAPYRPYNVELFPGASSDVWIGLLANKSEGFPLLKICYNASNSSAKTYAWLDTDPNRPELHQHNYVVSSQTPPTCYKDGSATYKCSCGDSYTTVIKTGGHSKTNGICILCGHNIPFDDVRTTDWYYNSVQFASNYGLFNGTGASTFSPDLTMTRAMLVTVLYRSEGSPNMESFASFSDVPFGMYYTYAVAWATENGIVNGMGNNRFAPDGTITREQMATILFRYASSVGIDTSARSDFNDFTDGNTVSGYATDAMSWAVATGLINGAGGKLMPRDGATRAQVATILMRFFQNLVFA